MAKEFRFKGKTLAELHAMSVEEFAALCNSRAKRSLKRTGENKHLLKKIANAKEQHKAGKSPKPIKTHLRDTVITPTMIGILFSIYRGNDFVVVEIKPEMLGHYFGEMALTRKRLLHGKAGIGATKSSTAITAR